MVKKARAQAVRHRRDLWWLPFMVGCIFIAIGGYCLYLFQAIEDATVNAEQDDFFEAIAGIFVFSAVGSQYLVAGLVLVGVGLVFVVWGILRG